MANDHDHPAPGDPSYDGFRITQLWAWTQVDPADNQEGIVGTLMGRNWMPLIASDRVRLDDLRPIARDMARTTGRAVRLRRFVAAEDVEVVDP